MSFSYYESFATSEREEEGEKERERETERKKGAMARNKNEGKGGASTSKRGGSGKNLVGGKGEGKGDKKGSKGNQQGSGMLAGKDANGVAGQSKISCADIQYVQNLIERCLQQYMTRKDVVFALQYQARIEPGFTTLVWQKLEEQNPDFFMAYHVRVKLKDQVVLFNHLLEQQMQMIQKMQSSHMGGAWQQKPGMGQAIQHPHLSNGFPMHPMHTGPMPHHGPSAGMMHPMDPNHPGLHHPGGPPPPHPGQMNPHGSQMGGPGNQGLPPYADMGPQMGPPMDMNMRQGNPNMQVNGMEQGNPVFGDYKQGRGMHPTVSEAPPFPAGLARPSSMNGLDLSQAEGQSHMIPKVFSLSDLTLELGAQLATDGDVSLSLLAGNESSGLGIFPRNLSLGDIAKLEAPEAGFS